MEPRQLSYRNSTIGYCRFGSGPKTAVCFHGYGEEASVFAFLAQYAGNQYSFYAIDLPFHGKTEWDDGWDFTHKDLQQIVEIITREDNQKSENKKQKITLIGFSLGGRAVLSLYQAMPERTDRIVLLAPDGLKIKPPPPRFKNQSNYRPASTPPILSSS